MGDDPLSWLIPAGAFGAVILFFIAVIEIDAGELLHRSLASPVEVSAETSDALLERQVVLARAIERARPR